MKQMLPLMLCLLLPSVLGNNLLRVRRQEDSSPCICVPYYQCPDGVIDEFGTFQIDPRIDPAEPNPTCSGVDICCALPPSYKPSPPEPRPGPTSPEPPAQPPVTVDPHPPGSTIPKPHPPPGVTGCGVKRLNPLDARIDDTDTRITGEKNVPEPTFYGEFPWMIAVFKEVNGKKEFICGGSLISPDVVLTAAHCIAKLEAHEVIVRAGDWDSRNSEEPIPHQDRRGKKMTVHSNFDPGNLRNDIALLFTDKPFDLGDTIDTICVEKLDFDPENCQATGWGVNSFNEQGLFQPILKKVWLPIVDRDTCQAKLKTTRLGAYFRLHESFMCAGGQVNQDTCLGDGGGPLVCSGFDGPHKFAQVGIVSWGIGCGKDTPAVYTSIDHFYDWIHDELNEK